jgi:hypothetical protein
LSGSESRVLSAGETGPAFPLRSNAGYEIRFSLASPATSAAPPATTPIGQIIRDCLKPGQAERPLRLKRWRRAHLTLARQFLLDDAP